MYIRSLFEANKHVQEPRQLRVMDPPDPVEGEQGGADHRDLVVDQGDPGPAGDVETPGSLPPTNRTGRSVLSEAPSAEQNLADSFRFQIRAESPLSPSGP